MLLKLSLMAAEGIQFLPVSNVKVIDVYGRVSSPLLMNILAQFCRCPAY